MAEASGRVSLRAGGRRHSPFIRQRRQKAMPARRCGKSLSAIAREGFLDRRSKRCFWLLLSPQTKVARAGARNYPSRRQRKRSRRGAKLSPSETNTTLTPLRGDASSVSFAGTCLPAGRSTDLTRHRRVIQYREPLKGKTNGGASFNTATHQGGRLTEVCHSTPRTLRGEGLSLCGLGTRLPVTSSGGRLTPADGRGAEDRMEVGSENTWKKEWNFCR